MTRTAAVCALALGLAACGDGNPFNETTGGGDTSSGTIYATALNEDLTMNSLVYDDNGTADPNDDTLVVNNLPFDNSDATGGGYTRAGALARGFDRYESPDLGTAAERQYFAVFRRSDHAQVAAVGTGDYVGFGFGGATAQRLGAGAVPTARPSTYTFNGDYAAVRITTQSGGSRDVEYVTGDAELYVDILDFDTNGAVEGIVDNRQLYDSSGNLLGSMTDFLSLATASVDFTNATINSSTAVNIGGGTQLGTGNWEGIFAGPNGEEIAGIVVIEGTEGSGAGSDQVRETGTLIVTNGG
mmetsp:Transcript_23503/g.41444  ORF Transcript_23503/g.41444 Transcript_23503/m.41444 type:complete len:299 (-) Transcript_23503:166-1062(-)